MDKNFSRDALSFTHMARGLKRHCLMAVLASCMVLAIFAEPIVAGAGEGGLNGEANRRHSLVKHPYSSEQGLRNNEHSVAATVEQLQADMTAIKNQLLLLNVTNLQNILNKAQSDITALNQRITITETALGTQANRITEVEKSSVPDLPHYLTIKTEPINGVTGPHVIFTGVNVHVRNGATQEATASTNGLGNLIVGYNEENAVMQRTGSHNLVGGSQNGFSSYGGLVFGTNNKITGTYAAVVGGSANSALSAGTSILGSTQKTLITNYFTSPTSGTPPPPPPPNGN